MTAQCRLYRYISTTTIISHAAERGMLQASVLHCTLRSIVRLLDIRRENTQAMYARECVIVDVLKRTSALY